MKKINPTIMNFVLIGLVIASFASMFAPLLTISTNNYYVSFYDAIYYTKGTFGGEFEAPEYCGTVISLIIFLLLAFCCSLACLIVDRVDIKNREIIEKVKFYLNVFGVICFTITTILAFCGYTAFTSMKHNTITDYSHRLYGWGCYLVGFESGAGLIITILQSIKLKPKLDY